MLLRVSTVRRGWINPEQVVEASFAASHVGVVVVSSDGRSHTLRGAQAEIFMGLMDTRFVLIQDSQMTNERRWVNPRFVTCVTQQGDTMKVYTTLGKERAVSKHLEQAVLDKMGALPPEEGPPTA
jgi:hypothetical protein